MNEANKPRIVYQREADGGATYASVGYEKAFLVIGEDAIYLGWTDYKKESNEVYYRILNAIKSLIENYDKR